MKKAIVLLGVLMGATCLGRLGQSEAIMLLPPLGKELENPAVCGQLLAAIGERTERAAFSKQGRFELVLRDGKDGGRYLCVINPDIDAAHEDVVSVAGEYSAVTDIDISGAFPIPATKRDGRTEFELRLDPCEATIVRLRE